MSALFEESSRPFKRQRTENAAEAAVTEVHTTTANTLNDLDDDIQDSHGEISVLDDADVLKELIEPGEDELSSVPWLKDICARYSLESRLNLVEFDEINIRTGLPEIDRGHFKARPDAEYDSDDCESSSDEMFGVVDDHEEDILDFLGNHDDADASNDSSVQDAQIEQEVARLFGADAPKVLEKLKKRLQESKTRQGAIVAQKMLQHKKHDDEEDDDLTILPNTPTISTPIRVHKEGTTRKTSNKNSLCIDVVSNVAATNYSTSTPCVSKARLMHSNSHNLLNSRTLRKSTSETYRLALSPGPSGIASQRCPPSQHDISQEATASLPTGQTSLTSSENLNSRSEPDFDCPSSQASSRTGPDQLCDARSPSAVENRRLRLRPVPTRSAACSSSSAVTYPGRYPENGVISYGRQASPKPAAPIATQSDDHERLPTTTMTSDVAKAHRSPAASTSESPSPLCQSRRNDASIPDSHMTIEEISRRLSQDSSPTITIWGAPGHPNKKGSKRSTMHDAFHFESPIIRYACQQCSCLMTSIYGLQKHVQSHGRAKTMGALSCPLCKKAYHSIHMMGKHILQCPMLHGLLVINIPLDLIQGLPPHDCISEDESQYDKALAPLAALDILKKPLHPPKPLTTAELLQMRLAVLGLDSAPSRAEEGSPNRYRDVMGRSKRHSKLISEPVLEQTRRELDSIADKFTANRAESILESSVPALPKHYKINEVQTLSGDSVPTQNFTTRQSTISPASTANSQTVYQPDFRPLVAESQTAELSMVGVQLQSVPSDANVRLKYGVRKPGSHLSPAECDAIDALLAQGLSIRKTAARLAVSATTICRYVKRNRASPSSIIQPREEKHTDVPLSSVVPANDTDTEQRAALVKSSDCSSDTKEAPAHRPSSDDDSLQSSTTDQPDAPISQSARLGLEGLRESSLSSGSRKSTEPATETIPENVSANIPCMKPDVNHLEQAAMVPQTSVPKNGEAQKQNTISSMPEQTLQEELKQVTPSVVVAEDDRVAVQLPKTTTRKATSKVKTRSSTPRSKRKSMIPLLIDEGDDASIDDYSTPVKFIRDYEETRTSSSIDSSNDLSREWYDKIHKSAKALDIEYSAPVDEPGSLLSWIRV